MVGEDGEEIMRKKREMGMIDVVGSGVNDGILQIERMKHGDEIETRTASPEQRHASPLYRT